MSHAGFFKKNMDELGADPVLRFYGAALAALHVLSFLFWHDLSVERILRTGRLALCWPFFERCADYRFLDAGGVRLVLWCYLGVSVLSVALFLSRRLLPYAYWTLVLVNVFKLAILVQDYRLRANQHYMALFVTLVFLFLPNKRRLLQYQVIAFYFWAGLLKLDREWFSGAALYGKPLGVPERLFPLACTYVVFLETCLVFGLLARRSWIFWATFAQLVVFHVTSWTVVGYFYPLLMFIILSIFPLARAFPSHGEPPGLRRLLTLREPPSTVAFLSFFSFLQMIPWVFPGDTAITGEGRLFALHMFDARVVCKGRVLLHATDGTILERPLRAHVGQRIRCDPMVYLSLARALCRRHCEERHQCTDLDLQLSARRSTDPELRPVIDIRNFCHSGVEYDLWRANAWILR